jgi:hypothetical protein
MIERDRKVAIPVINASATVGVLAEGEVLLADVVQGRRVPRSIPLSSTGNQTDRLLEQLWQSGLSTLWVMPGSNIARALTCAWFERAGPHWVVVAHPDQQEPARPLSVLLWPRGGGQREARRLTLVFPEHAGWNWKLSDAMSLLATVTYMDQALARPVVDAPDLVAHQLLADLTLAQPASAPLDLYTLTGSNGAQLPMMGNASEVAWTRPLTWVEERQKYLHKYTHFSPYIEACKTVQLGMGTPHYSANGQACDGLRPGIWRANIEPAGSVFDGKQLPKCADGEWLCTPQIKCCREIGYRVQVKEGYYWPRSQDALKRWATTLWLAGERLHTRPHIYRHMQARDNVSRSIRLLARLSLAIIEQDRATGGWARPDWQAQIASSSRAHLFTHLSRLVRQGTMPVLVYGDSFWVVSNDPNPLKAVPTLVQSRQWRGYSVGYEAPLPLSDNVRAILRRAEYAGQAASALDALAEEAG